MSADCIFCRIIDGKIPAPRVLETDDAIVIRDIQPQAKSHFLVIPKKHVPSLAEVLESTDGGSREIGALFSVIHRVAKQEGLLPDGFRTVINTREKGGQTVPHLHIHLLAGDGLGGRFG
jgi:histidine triad (HIT) family protein